MNLREQMNGDKKSESVSFDLQCKLQPYRWVPTRRYLKTLDMQRMARHDSNDMEIGNGWMCAWNLKLKF